MGGKAKVPPNQRSLNGRYLQRTNEGGGQARAGLVRISDLTGPGQLPEGAATKMSPKAARSPQYAIDGQPPR